MKPKLKFDYVVDKENSAMIITRQFAAARNLVWDCYTKNELLAQWFAPKPLTTKTKSMDFSEGGHWLYAMIDPEGAEYWGRMDYQTINPIDNLLSLSAVFTLACSRRLKLPLWVQQALGL